MSEPWADVFSDFFPRVRALSDADSVRRWERYISGKCGSIAPGELGHAIRWATENVTCGVYPTPQDLVGWLRRYRAWREDDELRRQIWPTMSKINQLPDDEAYEYICAMPDRMYRACPIEKWAERFHVRRMSVGIAIRKAMSKVLAAMQIRDVDDDISGDVV